MYYIVSRITLALWKEHSIFFEEFKQMLAYNYFYDSVWDGVLILFIIMYSHAIFTVNI
jgi:hypothetical protein